MKEEAISRLMANHTLPRHIAQQLVGEDGTVDNDKLQTLLLGVTWGKSPASKADPGLVSALSKSYYEYLDKKDVSACIRLKDAISKIGGQLEPRKA